jgi:hypothetical protein
MILGVIVFALIILGPLFTIWSLNTLFPALAIPYALETWAAVIILAATLRANVTVKKD